MESCFGFSLYAMELVSPRSFFTHINTKIRVLDGVANPKAVIGMNM